MPRTVIYEDTTITGEGMEVDRGLWERTLLPDLADLADLLPAFDLNVSRRLTAKGFFKARYGVGGQCEDVVRFCHEFQRDFFEPYTRRSMRRRQFDDDNEFVPQENWFKLEDIVAVDRAREAASLHLRELQGSSAPRRRRSLGADLCRRRRLPAKPVEEIHLGPASSTPYGVSCPRRRSWPSHGRSSPSWRRADMNQVGWSSTRRTRGSP